MWSCNFRVNVVRERYDYVTLDYVTLDMNIRVGYIFGFRIGIRILMNL